MGGARNITTVHHRARLTAARQAHDADDLRFLLDVLGLWPEQDTADDDNYRIGLKSLDPGTASVHRASHHRATEPKDVKR